ncbi:MAG: glycine cleavage system protein GcvH [Planctomycetota bacterium]
MKVPTDRRYAETHEWFRPDEDVITVGITQYAADELTDITFVELPEVGRKVSVGDSIGEVESVKATSEIFTSVAGKIVEVNASLADRPELINDDAFEEGWIVRLKPDAPDPLQTLLSSKEYVSLVKNA